MKIILNTDYRGFMVPDEICKLLHCDEFDNSMSIRTNPTFIQWIKQKKENGEKTDFEIVEIPDNASDYLIEDFDGEEGIYFVVDGKIYQV